jgi:hypothetical protein
VKTNKNQTLIHSWPSFSTKYTYNLLDLADNRVVIGVSLGSLLIQKCNFLTELTRKSCHSENVILYITPAISFLIFLFFFCFLTRLDLLYQRTSIAIKFICTACLLTLINLIKFLKLICFFQCL